ncbi:MAG: Rpn family recombination-promoting nuclease/putative transposase [Cyanobacteria bacterium P01_G01_bin.54]
MYDNCCKYLIETFPTDFATWLLGRPIPLTQLKPRELSNQPIHADALMLKGQDVVLHVEFQTEPDPKIPLRLANYYLRLYQKFPGKQIHQVVLYLRERDSPYVSQNKFETAVMVHRFNVVRLWEQPKALFWNSPGLLPLAMLSQAAQQNAEVLLRQTTQRIAEITQDQEMQGSLEAATGVLAGLKLKPAIIRQIIRSKAMRESLFYQDILREGREQGRQEGRREGRREGQLSVLRQIVPILQGWGVPVERLLAIVGISIAELGLDEEE